MKIPTGHLIVRAIKLCKKKKAVSFRTAFDYLIHIKNKIWLQHILLFQENLDEKLIHDFWQLWPPLSHFQRNLLFSPSSKAEPQLSLSKWIKHSPNACCGPGHQVTGKMPFVSLLPLTCLWHLMLLTRVLSGFYNMFCPQNQIITIID